MSYPGPGPGLVNKDTVRTANNPAISWPHIGERLITWACCCDMCLLCLRCRTQCIAPFTARPRGMAFHLLLYVLAAATDYRKPRGFSRHIFKHAQTRSVFPNTTITLESTISDVLYFWKTTRTPKGPHSKTEATVLRLNKIIQATSLPLGRGCRRSCSRGPRCSRTAWAAKKNS